MGGLLYLNVGFLVNSSDGRVLTIRRSLVISILLDPNFSTRVSFFFLFFLIREQEIFTNGRIAPRHLSPSLLHA